MNSAKVFISYAHSSQEHKQAVANLAAILRSKGLAVVMDADVKTPQGPEEGWPKWMKRQLREADWVLTFFDKTYRRRFDGDEAPEKGLGATWEGAIITSRYYRESTINKKFIPVLSDGTSVEVIPDEFFGYNHYHVPTQSNELACTLVTAASREAPASEASQTSLGTAVLKRQIEITLDTDLASFGPEQQKHFLGAVAKLLGIADVTIKTVRQGSVKVVLELPTEEANALQEAVKAGLLSDFLVVDAVLLDEQSLEVGRKAEATWSNQRGMVFTPLEKADVRFSVHRIRVRDFAAFVTATKRLAARPALSSEPSQPVVGVSWQEAMAFCEWLTDEGKKSGDIQQDESYRLPSEEEWAIAAAGLTSDKPYPWGNESIQTSRVGLFDESRAGFLDLAGNVWEWCADAYDESGRLRVLRGAAWTSPEGEVLLLQRDKAPIDLNYRTAEERPTFAHRDRISFRVVLEKETVASQ